MNRTIGLVTANFAIGGFGAIAEERPTVSIPFGGRYRLMDFALSNLVNARIQTVGMITPYRYRSIIDHIGAGKVHPARHGLRLPRKRGPLPVPGLPA